MKHSVKSKIISVTMAAAMAVSMAVPTFAASTSPFTEAKNTFTRSIKTAAMNSGNQNAFNLIDGVDNTINVLKGTPAKITEVTGVTYHPEKNYVTLDSMGNKITHMPYTETKQTRNMTLQESLHQIKEGIHPTYAYSANYMNNDTVISDLSKATTDWAAKIMQVPGDTITLMTDSARKAVQNQENIIGVDEVITDKSPATIENALRSLGGWGTITYQPVNHSYSKAGNISYFGNNVVGYDLDPVSAVKTRLSDNQQTLKKYVNGQKGTLDNVQSNLEQAKKDFNFGLGDTAENVMKDLNSATGNRLNYTIDSGSSVLPHISLGK